MDQIGNQTLVYRVSFGHSVDLSKSRNSGYSDFKATLQKEMDKLMANIDLSGTNFSIQEMNLNNNETVGFEITFDRSNASNDNKILKSLYNTENQFKNSDQFKLDLDLSQNLSYLAIGGYGESESTTLQDKESFYADKVEEINTFESVKAQFLEIEEKAFEKIRQQMKDDMEKDFQRRFLAKFHDKMDRIKGMTSMQELQRELLVTNSRVSNFNISTSELLNNKRISSIFNG